MTPESGYFEDDLMLYFLYKDVGNGVFPCSFIDIKNFAFKYLYLLSLVFQNISQIH